MSVRNEGKEKQKKKKPATEVSNSNAAETTCYNMAPICTSGQPTSIYHNCERD